MLCAGAAGTTQTPCGRNVGATMSNTMRWPRCHAGCCTRTSAGGMTVGPGGLIALWPRMGAVSAGSRMQWHPWKIPWQRSSHRSCTRCYFEPCVCGARMAKKNRKPGKQPTQAIDSGMWGRVISVDSSQMRTAPSPPLRAVAFSGMCGWRIWPCVQTHLLQVAAGGCRRLQATGRFTSCSLIQTESDASCYGARKGRGLHCFTDSGAWPRPKIAGACPACVFYCWGNTEVRNIVAPQPKRRKGRASTRTSQNTRPCCPRVPQPCNG